MSDRHGATQPDTFPKLILRNAERYRDKPAYREKDYGIWQTCTWRQSLDEVRAIACGLAKLGVVRGDKVAVIGDNRPKLYWSIVAAQCIGAIPVPIYQDSGAKEMEYVLDHADIGCAVVEDQEQVDKLLEIKERFAGLQAIIYGEVRGMRNYDHPFLHSLDDIKDQGRAYDAENPDFFLNEIAKGNGKDISAFFYTSGTTGQPKGVVVTYDNIITMARIAVEFEGLRHDEETLAYLPMAWVGDNIFSIAQAYLTGFCINCPESGATVLEDLREIGPTYFFAPPRIWENILTTVMIRMEDAAWLKRKMFQLFMNVARRAGVKILDGEPVRPSDRLLYLLGRMFVYGPLKNTLGFSRIRLAYTAGEAIGPDIFAFYRSLGINIKQLYGSTEASVFITIQPNAEVKPDTVGTPVKSVEIRIEDSGEVMFRSPGVFVEYLKNPEATKETKTADGWVHTGDAGFFDQDGHLKIIDRAKDIGKLNGGTMFAPKYLENKLKFFPNIREAVAFGHGQDYVSAFINIDLDAVGNWADRQGIPYSSYQELAAKPEVYDLIQGNIEQVNQDLAADPQLASSQITRFLVLHKELDADDGELTRTRKVRRRHVAEKYDELVNALYSGAERCKIETQVTFEDGRTGMVKADLAIREARRFDPMRAAS